MKKSFLITLLVIMTLVSFTITACTEQSTTTEPKSGNEEQNTEEPKVYKIGSMHPLTGNAAYWGNNGVNGARMAVDKINANGGINGVELVLEAHDTRNDSAEAVNVMQKLASDKEILAVIGSNISGECLAAGPIANREGVLQIGTAANAAGIPHIGEYSFSVALTSGIGTPKMLEYVRDNYGIKSIAIVTALNNDFSVDASGFFKSAANDLGLEITNEESYMDGDTNFSAQISKIVEKNPDAIGFSGFATENSLMVIEARNQGYEGLFLGTEGTIDATIFEKVAGDAINGMILYAGFVPGADDPISTAFVEEYRKIYGQDPDVVSQTCYDTVMLLADCLKKVGPDRKALRDEFAKTKDWQTHTSVGKITFNENREVAMPCYIVEYNDGEYTLLDIVQ